MCVYIYVCVYIYIYIYIYSMCGVRVIIGNGHRESGSNSR